MSSKVIDSKKYDTEYKGLAAVEIRRTALIGCKERYIAEIR